MNQHPDQHFIESLRTGDPRGIREIYQRFAPEALRWVLNNNGSAADARDVFQEAVAALFEKSRQPDFQLTCPLGALLYVLYSRKWLDRLRAKKREHEVRIAEADRYATEISPDALQLAEDTAENAFRQQRISKAFDQLSELCRNLLRLLADGISPQEAAVQLQFNSVDTLYRRKNACAGRWRELTGL